MFAKLLVMVLVTGATAAGLLVLRQQRIETAHELAAVHARLLEDERLLWKLQSDIAATCRTDTVRHMLDELSDDWSTLPDPVALETTAPPAQDPWLDPAP
jgi:hypothetical protein